MHVCISQKISPRTRIDHLSELKKRTTLDFQTAKAGSSSTVSPSGMKLQVACEVLDVHRAIPPGKPSLCNAEILFAAVMQLQVDFAY